MESSVDLFIVDFFINKLHRGVKRKSLQRHGFQKFLVVILTFYEDDQI